MGAGVSSGLQNQYEGLGASWVGSIPTYSRHISNIKALTNSLFEMVRVFLFI